MNSIGNPLSIGDVQRCSGRLAGQALSLRPCRSALAQEHIVGGVGRALEGAGLVAGSLKLAAYRVDPLHRGGGGEDAAAAVGNHLELEPGNIVRCRARSVTGGLADRGAAIAVFPVRSGIVAADGLAVDQQGRNRLARSGVSLTAGARLALPSSGMTWCTFRICRHCEERSDEAIRSFCVAMDCFAALAMTD